MNPELSLQMMQMMTGGVVAQSISVAGELGIADLLQAEKRTTENLAAAVGVIIETVVPDGNDASPSKLFDMFMMMLPDGLERNEGQFRSIFTMSGFELTGITPTQSPVSVIEASPV